MSAPPSRVPDLSEYHLHRSVDEATFEGVAVPGLRAEFFHRQHGTRTASVGRYFYASREVLRAWGWTDERHCAFSAIRGPEGAWLATTAGCPDVDILRDDGMVTGLRLGDGAGGSLLCQAGTINATAASRVGSAN